jgi:transglutaminase-like putative cysteine protease
MEVQADTMPDYLAAAALCDCDNPWLRGLAAEITRVADTPTDKALRIFAYVRDAIRFGLAFTRSKASQTLKRGYGECGTKTNAQVALLRAAGIPARFRWVRAKSEALHHLVAEFLYRQMPPTASHFWAECYLEGRWVSCEALLDRPLYESMLRAGLITKEQIPTIDWDGRSDLVLLGPWITEELGHLPGYDEALAALIRNKEGIPPLWFERLIAPWFYPLNLRPSQQIRRCPIRR